MAFARMIAGSWAEVVGPFSVGQGLDAFTYPASWLNGADAEQLADVGAVEIVEDVPPASPLQLVGQTLVDVEGVPHRRWVIPATADLRAARRANLAAIRWDRQQTMKWRGRIVAADDTTTGRIMAAVMRAQITGDQSAKVQWKFGDNDFDQLGILDLTAYGMAIGVHLQGCYDREAELVAAITAAADAASIAAIDFSTGWPD